MGHLELQCPHCDKRLKLSDEHAGKTIRCPACKQTFVVEARDAPRPATGRQAEPRKSPTAEPRGRASNSESSRRVEPAPPTPRQSSSRPPASRSPRRGDRPDRRRRQEVVDDDATPWDDGSELEDYNDPFVPQRSTTRRRQKSELPGKLLKVGLFVLLAMLMVGTVGGLGYFAYRHLGSSGGGSAGNAVNMAWLPENVEAMVFIRPADIAKSPFFAKLLQKAPNQAGLRMQNMSPEDVEYALIGFWKEPGTLEQIPGPLATIPFGVEGGWQQGAARLTVTRLRLDGIIPNGQKTREHQGIQLYQDGSGMISCLADSRTILIGSEKAVIAALDRNGKEFHQSKLEFVQSAGHLVVAGFSHKASNSPVSLSPGNPVEQIGQLIGDNTKCAAIVANFSDNVDITASIICHDAAGAERIDSELKSNIDKARQQMGLIGAFLPIPGMSDVLTEILNSVNVTRSSSQLTLQARVPSKLVDIIPAGGPGMPGTPMSPSGQPTGQPMSPPTSQPTGPPMGPPSGRPIGPPSLQP